MVNIPLDGKKFDNNFLGGSKGRGGHNRVNTFTNLQMKPHPGNHNYTDAWATNLTKNS